MPLAADENHLQKVKGAFNATHTHLQGMGATRALVERFLVEAVMPSGVREAYLEYINGLIIYNTMARGIIGKGYYKRAGIPQGDPFSIMIIVLMLRPWAVQMKELKVRPRILADVLLILAADYSVEGCID